MRLVQPVREDHRVIQVLPEPQDQWDSGDPVEAMVYQVKRANKDHRAPQARTAGMVNRAQWALRVCLELWAPLDHKAHPENLAKMVTKDHRDWLDPRVTLVAPETQVHPVNPANLERWENEDPSDHRAYRDSKDYQVPLDYPESQEKMAQLDHRDLRVNGDQLDHRVSVAPQVNVDNPALVELQVSEDQSALSVFQALRVKMA